MLTGLKEDFFEVVMAVIPLTLVIIVLQLFLVGMPIGIFIQFLIGTVMVIFGLMFFLQGVKVGLLPIGEMIGSELPSQGSLTLLLVVAFILGFAVTVAEPDVRILAHQVETVSGGDISKNILILTVALGVGIFMVLAMLRIVLGIPLAYLLIAGYVVIMILSFFTPPHFVPVAFDAGGVTTGPMTVPFILALGIGTASVLGGKSTLSESFGLVGLASIGPVIGVMLLGVIYG